MVKKKQRDLGRLAIAVAILILVNVIASLAFFRVDLTAEKRFTLSQVTKDLLVGLDDIVYFEVYLEGDFPAGFQRLGNETQRMLEEFKAHSENIDFVFVNPSESESQEERYEVYGQLQEKGLTPSTIQVDEGDNRSEQVIFPGAIVRYRNKEEAIQLLVNEQAPAEQVLNASVEALEYALANAIRKLSTERKPSIAFLQGHGELAEEQVADITASLEEYYSVEQFNLRQFAVDTTTGKPSILAQQRIMAYFDALIIAKPIESFSRLDQFLVDQYIMRGGKVMWLVDMVAAEMDSLATNNKIATFPRTDIGLDKQLFTYGARINFNLVQDFEAAPILIPEGNVGGTPQWALAPWYYFPMVRNAQTHPITTNINPVRMEFGNSIDTVVVQGVKKTFLLHSSKTSRLSSTPNIITLDLLLKKPDEDYFSKSEVPMAVLLEGTFTSHFKFSLAPKSDSPEAIEIVKESKANKMIVIADGDIIKNQTHKGESVPLGIDKWTYSRTNHIYGNKTFLMNALDYLLDDTGLNQIRKREVALRLLNKNTISQNKGLIKIVNVALPLVIVLLIGLLLRVLRRRKYAVKYEK
jgi:ABC-2 type transport system permease protein